MKREVIDNLISSPTARRLFLKRVGATGIGVAAATMLDGRLAVAQNPYPLTDADILNFALNLEYLEAEFYSVATTGETLEQLGILKPSQVSGPVTGGRKVPGLEGSPFAFLANALRDNEIEHVLLLRKALSTAAVPEPALDLNALGYGFAGVDDFLALSRQFEDVGVSAYLGAAPYLSAKQYLEVAAAILATEAQHSGAIRLSCIELGIKSPAVDQLDVPPTPQTPYDVDKNALSIPRTFAEVLNIVYHGGDCSGGFFPDGMNGAIKCQSQNWTTS